jgi:hypothetical protein
MTIPPELTEFVPEKIDYGFRSWQLKASEFEDYIEIRNLIFSRKLIGTIVAVITFMAFIIAVGTVGVLMSNNQGPVPKPLFIAGFVSVCFLITGVIIAFFIGGTWSNASHWKGGLRFQYSKSTGELFFPREDARYSRKDYDELILGTSNGYDIADILLEHERKENSNKRHYSPPTLFTQVYFLVHRKDGTWTRHLIAYEQRSEGDHMGIAADRKGFEKIQEAVQCQTVARTMTQQECYTAQHKTADPEAKLTQPPKPMRFGILFYCFMSIFLLGALFFFGIGCYQLYLANATLSWYTTEGIITRSEKNIAGKDQVTLSINYDYTVDGERYTGKTYQYGSFGTREGTEKIVAQHPVGTVVKVYYSPQSPEQSVLVPGAGVGSYIAIVFGIVMSLAVLAAMFLIPAAFRLMDSGLHHKFVGTFTSQKPESD